MKSITMTRMWKETLLAKENDIYDAERERLRTSFIQFRKKASDLANEIHRSVPEYTVHDISHLDVLWEMADIIIGDDYELTPTEVFVLGGSILLHDLGMGLSAYRNGLDDIIGTEYWNDIVTNIYLRKNGRNPTKEELLNPEEMIKNEALSDFLRRNHALQAEKLVTMYWENKENHAQIFMIDDMEIRQTLGRIIGKIASSHWWDIKKVETEFSRVIGAPSWCPKEWQVDPLKLSCILRVADATHIDSRRAPYFLRILRNLKGISNNHWGFQEKLLKPYLKEDSLCFSSGYAFEFSEASQWWLCYETLKLIDNELRQVDSLLADKNMNRFQAKRVFWIESSERLTSLIPVNNWVPFDAFVHVGDIPKIIRSLGGEELYGKKNYNVAIRELIQNSTDAIRARRVVENRDCEYGEVVVSLGNDEIGDYIEVTDNGIGMSLNNIKDFLLNFGSSYWTSDLLREEYPGLISSGIKQTGKYGIGFFSIFMLGDKIKVTTRQCIAGQADTIVLEFGNSLNSRPIVRKAEPNEYSRDGGTKVKVWFKEDSIKDVILESRYDKNKKHSFEEIVVSIAPSLDMKLIIVDKIKDEKKEYKANYWLVCSNEDFYNYVMNINSIFKFPNEEKTNYEKLEFLKKYFINNTEKLEDDKDIYGRGCICVLNEDNYFGSTSGYLTSGGFFSNGLKGIFGIMKGNILNASRNHSELLAPNSLISNWASKFDSNEVRNNVSLKKLINISQLVRSLGGSNKELYTALYSNNCLKQNELVEIIKDKMEIIIVDMFFNEYEKKNFPNFIPKDNVIFTITSSLQPIIQSEHYCREKFNNKFNNWYLDNTNLGFVVEALCSAWEMDIQAFIGRNERFMDKFELKDVHIGNNENLEVNRRAYVFKRDEILDKIK